MRSPALSARSWSSGAAPEVTIPSLEKSRSVTCGALASASTTGGATCRRVIPWFSTMSSIWSKSKRGITTILAPLASPWFSTTVWP